MQHMNTDISVIVCNLHCMILAVSQGVLAEGFGVCSRLTVVTHYLEVCSGIAVQDIANQDLKYDDSILKGSIYYSIRRNCQAVSGEPHARHIFYDINEYY